MHNFNLFSTLFKKLGKPTELIEKRKKIRYVLYKDVNVDYLNEFINNYKINIPSINNEVIAEYIKQQKLNNNIKEWNICIVSNTDSDVYLYDQIQGKTPNKDSRKQMPTKKYSIELGSDLIELSSSVRNQTENHELYKITKNQIDDTIDRQVDLLENGDGSIKERRAREKKGLLLLYALDDRGTSDVDFGVPIIGYSLHFPKIDHEVKVSYMATTKDDFENEPMVDDDNIENE